LKFVTFWVIPHCKGAVCQWNPPTRLSCEILSWDGKDIEHEFHRQRLPLYNGAHNRPVEFESQRNDQGPSLTLSHNLMDSCT